MNGVRDGLYKGERGLGGEGEPFSNRLKKIEKKLQI